MTHLVQKTITDKNGVISTRWVKPEANGSSSKSMPSPSIAKPQKQSPTPLLYEEFNSTMLATTTITLDSFDPRAVQALESLLDTTAAISPVVKARAERALFNAFKDVYDAMFAPNFDTPDKEADEVTVLAPVHNLAVFGETIFTAEAINIDADSLIWGLDQSEGFNDYLLEADEDELRSARAVLTVASRIREPFITVNESDPDEDYYYTDDSGDDYEIFITSKALLGLINERPEDAAEIASIINARESDDVGMIRSVLDGEQKALREGIL